MSSAVAADLCRVVVVTPKSSAELAIPASVAIGDLLPALVHHSGAAEEGTPEYDKRWVLQRLGQAPLDVNATPAALSIREGETLYLRTASTQLPASHFDDLIDGVATGVGNRPDRWGAEATRWVFRAMLAGILLFGLWLSWTGPLIVQGATTGALSVLLLVGAASASRALGDRPLALVLALSAIPYAAVAGLVVPRLPGDSLLTAPSVLCASVAMTLVALMAMAAVGSDEVIFAPLAVAAGGGVAGASLSVFSAMSGAQAAAIVLGFTLVLSVFAPTTAFRLARLKLPMLPIRPEDLSRDIDPIPGPALLAQAAVADRYLTGMFLAVGFISLGSVTVIAGGGGGIAAAICLTTAGVLLLRSRGLVSTWQRLSAVIPATYALALVMIGAASRADWLARLGLMLVPALGAALLAVVFSRTLPGRRIHPLWGRIGDIFEWLVAIAMIPLVLAEVGVFDWARAIAG